MGASLVRARLVRVAMSQLVTPAPTSLTIQAKTRCDQSITREEAKKRIKISQGLVHIHLRCLGPMVVKCHHCRVLTNRRLSIIVILIRSVAAVETMNRMPIIPAIQRQSVGLQTQNTWQNRRRKL